VTRTAFTHRLVRLVRGALVITAAVLLWAGTRAPESRQASGGARSDRPLWLVPDAVLASPEPLLAEAVRLVENDQVAIALPLIDEAGADPQVAGYVTLHAGRARLALGEVDEALRAARRVLDAEPTGYLRESAAWLAADALTEVEDWPAVVGVLDDLLAVEPLDPVPAWERLGRAAEEAGDVERAVAVYRRLYFEYPLSEQAELAATALERLEGTDPLVAGPAPAELARAERLFAGGRYAEARAAFDAWKEAAASAERPTIDLRLVECDFYLGRYRDTLTAAERLASAGGPPAIEAEFYALGALRGLGRYESYIARVRTFVSRHPSHPLAERALNELGTHYIIEDEDAEAAGVFADLYARAPEGRYAERAAWKAGWWAYKTGEYRAAIRLFESAAVTFPRADYRPWWLYWAARSYDRLGERDAAVDAFRRVIVFYRNSYYGRAASRELTRLGIAADTAVSPTSAIGVSVLDLEPGEPPAEAPLIRALVEAGLYGDAVHEIEYIERRTGSSPLLQATRAWALMRAGELRPAITAMRRAYPEFMAAGGEALPVEILRVIFPIDYGDLIASEARDRRLDPFLMTALVAQESTFQADVRSAANAWGLMQILPATGQRIAPDAGIRRFNASMLTDPTTNVRIGMTYFAGLVREFGATGLALAAYNAGEHRVVEWIAERPGLAPDEFIDDIPFPETQNYVKRILGTADDYRLLYAHLDRPSAALASRSIQP